MGINQYIKIGSKIKRARISKGIRQKDMAAKLGLSVSTYSNYENNYREPKLDIVEKICEILDMTIDELMDFPIRDDDSCATDSLSYENSYSFASSAEEFDKLQKEHQKDESEEINTVHKYDASIRINCDLTPEKIEYQKEINRIYKKIENKENLTKDELQILKDDNERQKTAMEHLRETLRTMQEKLIPAYEKLNKTGQEEAAKRIEELTEISRYTKSDEPSEE